MDSNNQAVTIFDETTCWEHLAQQRVGRLVTHVGDAVDIVPVNFVVDQGSIVFRTAAGSKLAGLSINDAVVFQVDEVGEAFGWSVVLHGRARVLDAEGEIAAAEKLPLTPFVATLKPTFVRIQAGALSGRSFVFGEEPRQEDSQEG